MQNEQDPTDWENCYREGSTPWDKGSPAPPLLEYLDEHEVSGRVFVPGCGLGHDVRALASSAGAPKVIGLDISASAIEGAEKEPKAGSESYVLGDLFDLTGDLAGSFDWVFEHTCLSGLPPTLRADYVSAFHKALRPGGQVLAIFFLTPWDEGEIPEPPPYGVTTAELDAMFANRFEFVREWEPQRHYPGREGRELMRLLKKI